MSVVGVKHQSGAALIFALLVSLLLGVFAGFFTYKAQQNIRLAERISEHLLARVIADSSLDKAIYAVSSLGFTGVGWPDTGVNYSGRFWGARETVLPGITVSYEELSSKLSLIPFKRSEWISILQFYGMNDVAAKGVSDKIEDWIDSDSFRRIQGLEKRGYQYNNSPIYPRNAIMQSLDELNFIPGIDQSVMDKLADELVYWGTSERSPMHGSDAMVLAYGDLDLLNKVKELRNADGSLRLAYNSLKGVDASVVNGIPSGFFRITVEVELDNSYFKRVASVNLRGSDIRPFYVIGWQ